MRTLILSAIVAIFSAAGITSAQTGPASPPTRDAAQMGQSYLVGSFGPWERRCIKQDGDEPCQVYQLLREPNGNPVAEFTIFPLEPTAENPAVAGASLLVPLEVLLTANVVLAIDDKLSKTYPYLTCTPAGCLSRIGFTAEEVDLMRAGKTVFITIVPAAAPTQRAVLELNLDQFGTAMDSFKAQ